MTDAKLGFEMRRINLRLDAILPVRQVKEPKNGTGRYGMMLASIKTSGLVEPLMVYPVKDNAGKYLLLDGHHRYFALRELGRIEAECLVSTDDEGFTYNARVSRFVCNSSYQKVWSVRNSSKRNAHYCPDAESSAREVAFPSCDNTRLLISRANRLTAPTSNPRCVFGYESANQLNVEPQEAECAMGR